MKLKLLTLLGATLTLFACGAAELPKSDANLNSAAKNQNVNAGNTNIEKAALEKNGNLNAVDSEKLILSGTGKTETFPCNGREVEVEESTTANKYTLTGECRKVVVDGVANEVTIDKVGEIKVIGTSNKVVYGEGLDGKSPKITKSGVSLSVDSKKALEKKNSETK